ncbi:MAG: ABC transporter permease [Planctomycetaceae bacterium]|nr:ABC transporter permease [Planctomycetaceae bacterium]
MAKLAVFQELLFLLLIDFVFVGVLLLALVPLMRYKHAAYAVLKRNFIGYFSNPTGYVFLCLFVLLSSFAAFWPHEFFTANLANLDQLNLYLPAILLVFIPAITMSIWSEERRQGTDELLLTLPAADFDIVIGKYLAAAAIFTASLLFSQISNFTVLLSLAMGDVDLGLFLTTYLGYWFTGLAMISIGMMASFLTKNLTIGFILGLIFNMPLVFMKMADVLPSKVNWPFLSNVNVSRLVSDWSIASQFDPFGRGVISLSSVVYFVLIILVGLYLSMLLIGARHWYGGRDGQSLLGHYAVRSISMVVVALSIAAFFSGNDRIRFDMTDGGISSLSPDTKRLVRELKPDQTIYIDAFISGDVPEQYVKTRVNLLSMLKEFQAMAGDKIHVNIHNNLEPFSEEAALAEEQFGIRPEHIRIRSRGTITDEEIILGAAFRCGLQKVVVPFFDYGIPVEYELIRSINTVARSERKTIGVARTDAQLFGGFTFAGGQPRQLPRQAIIEELEKQYDVEEVDLTQPVAEDRYDVLLAVQPSSLPPEGMEFLVQAIRSGIPTAVFEDPLPAFMPGIPGTGQPKQAPGGMFGMGGRPMPKADIRKLWELLGIDAQGVPGEEGLFSPDLVWQRYNPYPKLQLSGIPDEWVFVREEPGEPAGLINTENVITSGLDEIFLPYPGMIRPTPASDLKFVKLLTTRELSGTIGFEQLIQHQADPAMLRALQHRRGNMTLAALIESEPDDAPTPTRTNTQQAPADDDPAQPAPADGVTDDATSDQPPADDDPADQSAPTAAPADQQPAEDSPASSRIKVVYVSDIDLMIPAFLRIRARPDEQEDIRWEFENVTFLLNIIDVLASETDYIEIRKRKPRYSTLQVVEARVAEARDEEFAKRVEFQAKYDKAVQEAEAENERAIQEFQKNVDDLKKQQAEGKAINQAELLEKVQRLEETRKVLERRLGIQKQRYERERERDVKRIQRDVDLEIQRTQFFYKFWAVAIPWIPPFLVGIVVFVRRRLREREGIEKSRLR